MSGAIAIVISLFALGIFWPRRKKRNRYTSELGRPDPACQRWNESWRVHAPDQRF